jgi:Zn-dependent peptidase ImmA (M78 family)/DNA-binding XRE family transcriptional regulator
METNHAKILGQRISRLRKNLNLTQKDLAIHLAVGSPQIISQIERGERDVKAWELAKLSKALFVDVSDLLATEHQAVEQPVLWRVLPLSEQAIKEARFLKRCKEYAALEDLSGTTRRRQFPQKDVDPHTVNFSDAARLAEIIRTEFALGARPAASLEKTLEDQFGVKIWYENLDEGSAAATIGDFGPAILMNRAEAPWRRNYNFAHELFHLITWNSVPAKMLQENQTLWEWIEKVANSFASCLLLPGDSVSVEIEERAENGQLEDTDLIEIARKFDVSTEALLFRLLNLRLISKETVDAILSDEDFHSLDRSTMSASWWEPPTVPERFVRLAFIAYQKGRISRARLAHLLDTTLPDVTETLLKYGLDDRESYKKIDLRAA